jgi:predicted phage baseplate assembly protein
MLAGVQQGLDPTLPGDIVHTLLRLATPLAYTYKRATVKIWGNVVRATHGETREEVLGSGDASRAFQTFSLSAKPLTWLAAGNALGAASTLELRVDELRWHEADSLLWLGPKERGYLLRTADDDSTTIVTGDGRHGVRPPTGATNVRAVYRTGVGPAGNVRAGQISQLQSRPLGVGGVINPLRASGGAARESAGEARRNAPLGLLTFGRIVSVQDYADFARARAGIGKAEARRLTDGRREVVHLTIAGSGDIPIDVTSDLYRSLRQALTTLGDPSAAVEIAPRELSLILLSAGVALEHDYAWEFVEPRVRAALLSAFSFEQRQLGQDVLLSEVIATIQGVAGVRYVDVDLLGLLPEGIGPAELATRVANLKSPPPAYLPVAPARYQRETHAANGSETVAAIAARFGLTLDALLQLNPGLTGLTPAAGAEIVVRRGFRAAQLALLSPALPETLILEERAP